MIRSPFTPYSIYLRATNRVQGLAVMVGSLIEYGVYGDL